MPINAHHTDEELICLMKEGSETAFDEIYRRYWKKLYNEAFRRLQRPELCEELVQDVFIDLWNNKESRFIDSLAPYLFQAVRYQVIAQYKKIGKLPHFEEPLENMAISPLDADAPCFEKDLISAIEKWLDFQPEKRRKILHLRYLEGMATKDIAEELNISQKTVQNQLITGQESLRLSILKFFALSLLLFWGSKI